MKLDEPWWRIAFHTVITWVPEGLEGKLDVILPEETKCQWYNDGGRDDDDKDDDDAWRW